MAVEFDLFQNIEDINSCKLIMNELCELGNLNMLKDYKCILKSVTTYHLMELQINAMLGYKVIESLYNFFVRMDRLHTYCNVMYCNVLYCIVLYCIVLYCIVLYCIVLYCIVLYCISLCRIVLYCIVLYCIVLYCIVLYFIVSYCIVLYCIAL